MDHSKLEQWAKKEIQQRALHNYAGTLAGMLHDHMTDSQYVDLKSAILNSTIEDRPTFRPIQDWIDSLNGNSEVLVDILTHDQEEDNHLLNAMPDFLAEDQLSATATMLYQMTEDLNMGMALELIEQALEH